MAAAETTTEFLTMVNILNGCMVNKHECPINYEVIIVLIQNMLEIKIIFFIHVLLH